MKITVGRKNRASELHTLPPPLGPFANLHTIVQVIEKYAKHKRFKCLRQKIKGIPFLMKERRWFQSKEGLGAGVSPWGYV